MKRALVLLTALGSLACDVGHRRYVVRELDPPPPREIPFELDCRAVGPTLRIATMVRNTTGQPLVASVPRIAVQDRGGRSWRPSAAAMPADASGRTRTRGIEYYLTREFTIAPGEEWRTIVEGFPAPGQDVSRLTVAQSLQRSDRSSLVVSALCELP